MYQTKVRFLFLVSTLFWLGGCATLESIVTHPFSDDVRPGNPSNSIISSLAPADVLKRLGLPREAFVLWTRKKEPWSPSSLNGRKTSDFAEKIGSMPIDGNFRVEVIAGAQELGFSHYHGSLVKEFVIRFVAEPGHEYYVKFLTAKVPGDPWRYRVEPVVYDLTADQWVLWDFVSDAVIRN